MILCAGKFSFYYWLYLYPSFKETREAKKKKLKEDKMPKNDLEIRLITSPEVIKVPRVKSFAGTEQRSSKKAPEPEGAEFIIYNPVLKKEFRFNDVTEFSVAKEGKTISILQNIPDTLKISKICVTLFNTRELNSLLN